MIIKVKTIPFREKVADKFISCIFALLFFITIPLYSQTVSTQSDSTQNNILDTKITLSLKNTSIQKILDTLSSYPNIKFSYVNYDFPLQNEIDVEATDQPLQKVLDDIFRPYRIKYYLISKQIVLKKEKKKIELGDNLLAPHAHSKISITYFNSIGISYRNLSSNNPILISERNKDEKSIRNFVAGCYVSYRYHPTVILRTGIAFLNTGERGTVSYLSIDTIVPGNNGSGSGSGNGNGNGNNLDTLTISFGGYYKNKYNYLTVPFMVGYTLEKQKISVSALAGFGLGFFLNYSTTFPLGINNYQNSTAEQKITPLYQKDARTHSYRNIVLILPVMIEMEYLISNDLELFGGIGLHYFTSSIYDSDQHVKHRPYCLNAAIGLTFHLHETAK